VSYNKFEKELRPFIGILFQIDTCEYFAPLSSPKPKHKKMKNTVDFFKIKDGELGAVNFNNMIPVNEKDSFIVDVEKSKYKDYFNKEIAYLRKQSVIQEILRKVDNIFKVLENSNNPDYNFFKKLCCDFKLLEEKCKEYKGIF